MESINIESLKRRLKFIGSFIEDTGEASETYTCKYHFCTITIYSNSNVEFKGSIHKMYNSINNIYPPNHNKLKSKNSYKGFNGNMLNLEKTLFIKEHLAKLFQCKPDKMIFQNIEFAYNVETKFNPQLFLKGLLFHHNKCFEHRYNRTFFQVVHQTFLLKFYWKSKQFKMKNDILRIEIHYKKMSEVKEIGIYNFDDINNLTLTNATNLLLKRFEEIIYYDYTLNKELLTKKEHDLIQNYKDVNYWLNELDSIHRDRPKKRLKKLIDEKSLNTKQQIINKIEEMCVIYTQA